MEIFKDSVVRLSNVIADSLKAKIQLNESSTVSVDNLTVKEGRKLNLQAYHDNRIEEPAGEITFNLSNVVLADNAKLCASVYEDTQPDISIAGNLNVELGKGSILDLGGATNSDWRDNKINIDTPSIQINVSDSDNTGKVYLSESGTDMAATKVTVTASGSNNTGDAAGDLAKLADVVQLTSKTDYTADRGDVTEKKAAAGTIVEVAANDIFDAASAVTTEDGGITDVRTTDNPNTHGISEMTALAVHIWRNEINDMNKRLGELRDSSAESNGVWARVYNGKAKIGGQGITNKYTAFQFGYDRQVTDGVWLGGALSYTNGNNDFSRGDGDSSLFGFTAYGSWLGDNGMFLDVTGKVGRMKNSYDIALDTGMSSASYHTNAVSMSAETGWRLYPLQNVIFVEPQIELMYGHVFDADYTTSTGVSVNQASSEALIGRAGIVLGLTCPNNRGNAFIRASVLHDWKGDADFSFTKGTGRRTLSEDLGGTWYEYGLGTNFNATKNIHVYADLEASASGKVETDYRFNLGVRYAW